MLNTKTHGKENKTTVPDSEFQEKLNTLDSLIKVRAQNTEDTKVENPEEEEERGLPGYEGTF